MAALAGSLIGITVFRMYGLVRNGGFSTWKLVPNAVRFAMYGSIAIFFLQLSMGSHWEGQYIFPIRDLQLLEALKYPVVALSMGSMLAVVSIGIKSTLKGLSGLLVLVLKQDAKSAAGKFKFSLMMALGLAFMLKTVLPADVPNYIESVTQLFGEKGKALLEKSSVYNQLAELVASAGMGRNKSA